MTQANAKPSIIHCSLMKLTIFQNFAMCPFEGVLASTGEANAGEGDMLSASWCVRLGEVVTTWSLDRNSISVMSNCRWSHLQCQASREKVHD